MTIPVQVEFGSHVLLTKMPAVPRAGERITCVFPGMDEAAGQLVLTVLRVNYHQPLGVELHGRVCPEPFGVTLETDGDPEFSEKNSGLMLKAHGIPSD